MNTLKDRALAAHEKNHGKIGIELKVEASNSEQLSLYYSPGVAEPCKEIQRDPDLAYKYTWKGRTVAVISDGTAVLGLGDIGPLAGLPVMEGKAMLFKAFADIDAIPICLDTKDPEEIIKIVKSLAPSFGGINLEDIAAPNCFAIEERLKNELNIPVFHDDQHGTAIVCLAGLINSLKITGKNKESVKVVISGAGAAGIAIAKILLLYGFKNLILQDSQGLIYEGRENLNTSKIEIAKVTNREKIRGGLREALVGADIFLGLSKPNLFTQVEVKTMAQDPIIFAMSNPDPEITPEEAKAGGARIVATGRGDYPNQVNNVLAFPGIFHGALKSRATKITDEMKIHAAEALAQLVENPTPEKIIPGPFDPGVCEAVSKAVQSLAPKYN